MRAIGRTMGALSLALALALSSWMAAPAQAAGQTELETKIKTMEQALQSMKQQLEQVKQEQARQGQAVEVAASKAAQAKLPSWVERMTFFGDTRFRYEHTNYDDTVIAGKTKTKSGVDRFRVRLRFGVRSQIHPDVELGFRMASGSDTDGTSTNQTMGNYFGEYSSWGIDQAYVKWNPSFVPTKAATFSFGKVPQPFMTSKIIWDGDVVPEGGFINFTFNKGGGVQPFITAAYMTVNQSGEFGDNVLAPAVQAGAKVKLGSFRLDGALGYTSWGDLGDVGKLPPSLRGTPSYTEGGGTRTTNYAVFDAYAKASFAFAPKGSLGVWGHYLKNNDSEGPYQDKDQGYGAGVFVKYDKFGFNLWYKSVEANATPGFIADSDSGYVNIKGWIANVSYKMWKYGTVELSYYSMEPEDASISTASNKYQTVFVDFVFKF
ncbi:MAG: putative porin [Thermodesulfobacteriota bacterium]